MDDPRKLPGLKARDITKTLSGKGIGAEGPVFYRVSIETCCLDPNAIRRLAGLEALVGNAAVAQALSPDEDLAKIIHRTVSFALVTDLHRSLAAVLED